ncbi:MAG TPA: NYN domain-containing protein [Chthoniobacterales bacterium]|nr:NYN domain-containing protein [Chthoniobacterales bacterium]
MRADFALRLTGLRPIEREYGSATSGANKAAPARSLSGTKKSGRQNCARPAGDSEADKSEAQEASRGVSQGRLTFSQTRPVLRAEYLIVDGHSVIFAWPELRRLHARRTSLARDALTKKLRDYQDWTETRVAVVFDGKGKSISASSYPGEIQVFYSRAGQTADSIIERLASKYGGRYRLLVATSDVLEQETASACGAECISAEALRWLLEDATPK